MEESSGVGAGDGEDSHVLKPLVVCGPSGVGKGTIIAKYMNEFGGSNHFGFTVSHTTRQPREGEVDGVHYHFVPIDRMKDDIARGKFIEHAEVHGNLYGTSFASMEHVEQNQGKICLLDIDVQGVKNIKEQQRRGRIKVGAKFVFISPPSVEELRARLLNRGSETPESLNRRTSNAPAEMEYGLQVGNFDEVVVNGDLDQACRDFDVAVKKLYGCLG